MQEISPEVIDSIGGATRSFTKSYEYADPRHPGKETRVVDYDGTVIEYTYDDAGNTTTVTTTGVDASQSSSVEYAHDEFGNITDLVDPRGNLTAFVYNSRGIPDSIVTAAGDVAQLLFEGTQQTSFTDFNGNTTTYEYQVGAPNGKPAKTIHPDGSYEIRQWNHYYDLTSVEVYDVDDNLVYATQSTYDSLRRRTRVTTGVGEDQIVVAYEYDGSTKNVTTETIVHPTDAALNRTTYYEYDHAGNLIRHVDPGLDVSDPAAGVHFKYDANGNRIWLRDPVGNVTTWIYDSLDRVIEERDPLYWEGADWDSITAQEIVDLISTPTPVQNAPFEPSHVTRYAYDAVGNLVEEIDRNGRRRTYDYDYLGNLTSEIWFNATDDTTVLREIAFTYDTAGNMLSAADPDAEYAFTYDTMNRLGSMVVDYPWTSDVDTFTMDYEYDAMGNVTSATDSTGVSVRSTYEDRNQLASRWWEGVDVQNIRADLQYTTVGQVAELTRYSDLAGSDLVARTDYGYDTTGRPTSIQHANAIDEVLTRYDYEYDYAGLPTRETLDHITAAYDRSADYSYDLRGQLIAAMYDNDQVDETFSYDANGNRTLTGYVTDAAIQLLSDGTYDYTYDAEGNVTSKTAIAPVAGEVNHTEYEYDFRNRLTKVTQYSQAPSEGGVILHEESYRYDALGRRVQVISDGEETTSVYDTRSFMANEWARFNGDGEITQRFLFTNQVDKLIAQWTPGQGTAWVLADHLGTVRDMIDNAQQFIQHINYTAFGRPTFEVPVANSHPYAFTGRVWDSMSGTAFHRARIYDAHTGRFVTQDPLGFDAGTFGLYEYARNMPTWHSDPSGRVSITEYALISTFISTLAGGVFSAARGGSFADGATNGFVFGLLSSLTLGIFMAASATTAAVVISGLFSAATGGFLDAANHFSGGRVQEAIDRAIDEVGGDWITPVWREYIKNLVFSAIY